MQTIQTKYIPASNTRGSRIKAWCDAGNISIPYPHELTGQACHRAAAVALCKKLGADWPNDPMLGGSLPNNKGHVFVFYNSWARD